MLVITKNFLKPHIVVYQGPIIGCSLRFSSFSNKFSEIELFESSIISERYYIMASLYHGGRTLESQLPGSYDMGFDLFCRELGCSAVGFVPYEGNCMSGTVRCSMRQGGYGSLGQKRTTGRRLTQWTPPVLHRRVEMRLILEIVVVTKVTVIEQFPSEEQALTCGWDTIFAVNHFFELHNERREICKHSTSNCLECSNE